MAKPSLTTLLRNVRACDVCKQDLPLGPRPVLQGSKQSRILIAGQAPGSKVHKTGIPFDDPSGKRLREWLGVTDEQFYDPSQFAILPMGFCFPGTGKSGDFPPRPECAEKWREPLLTAINKLQLTLVIGQYAQRYHLPDHKGSVTEIVAAYKTMDPSVIPLPHPSPRNNRWLKNNPWFEVELLPHLQARVKEALA